MRFILSLSFLFSILFANAQQFATVKGVITNNDQKVITLKEQGLPFNFSNGKGYPINADGTFEFEVSMPYASYFQLKYGTANRVIYLAPGDDLEIAFDAKNFINLKYVGGSAKSPNQYLRLKRPKQNKNLLTDYRLFNMDYAAFKTQMTTYRQVMDEYIAKYEKESDYKGKTTFLQYEKADVLYKWAMKYLQYGPYHAHYQKKNALDVMQSIDVDYASEVDLNASSLLMVKAYRDYVDYNLSIRTDEESFKNPQIKKSHAHYAIGRYNYAQQYYKNQAIINYLRTRILYEHMDKKGSSGMEQAIAHHDQTVKNPNYKQAVQISYDKWAAIKTGEKAPEFEGTDVEGNPVKLSDFKGKYVYVDVWATWCGPCRKEIPMLEKMNEKFEGTDVVIISASIDKNKKAWQNKVKKDEMTGVQMHIPGGWRSTICKDYKISSIPRFLLINKDGTILNSNAPRPSQGAEQLLTKLLASK